MLDGRTILQLIQMRQVFAMIRAAQAYRGTPARKHRKHDRSMGPTDGVQSIHNLRHAINRGFRA